MRKYLLSGMLFFIVVPLIYVIMLSFNQFYRYPLLLPRDMTLSYYNQLLLQNPLFIRGVATSLFVGTMTAFSSVLIGYLNGRAFTRYLDMPYIVVLIFYALPIFMPAMVLFLGVHQMILKTPFTNSYLGVVISHTLISLPYTSMIFYNYLQGIPVEIEQAAVVLGANKLQVYKKVLVPMLTPAIGLSVVVSMIISGTEYLATFLIGGGNIITLPMVIYPFISNSDYGLSAVSGIVFVVVYGSVFLIVQKITKKPISTKMLYIE